MVNETTPRILAIIPARFASSRFPGKPLVLIQGESMISRVVKQVSQSKMLSRVLVATDDQRIFDHVEQIGSQVVMTRGDHPSGTDRCAEVAAKFPEYDVIINVQGDEPFIQPQQIDLLAQTLLVKPESQIATLAKKITEHTDLFNPNIVKVVANRVGRAIYFSRHPIPFLRGQEQANWLEHHDFYKHIGLYGFRRATLLELAALQPTPLEKAESLEQLRWLEHGYPIEVGITELETIGVDMPEDLYRVGGLG
jgi:3-deoxy-manno-octulosonate cytidylyltransferase (CMP-KDO synthetase)